MKSQSETTLEGQFVGDLHFTKTGTPTLIIGHHLMYGKMMTIDPPFALLEKKTDPGLNTTNTTVEYVVAAIIKRKIIFKTRPKPIVGGST